MQSNRQLIFILVDALRWDYINKSDSPFMDSLAKEGISGSAIPSFGFEPDAAYLAGLNPEDADGGAMFWKHDKNKDFSFSKYIPRYFDRISGKLNWICRKFLRLICQIFARTNRIKKYCDPSKIPFKYLDMFSFSSVMSFFPWEKGFLQDSTIFHELKDKNINFFYHCIPTYKVKSDVVLNRFLEEYSRDNQYAFLFIGDLDSIGHIYGPNSIERKDALKVVDKRIKKIYNHAKSINNDIDIVILGDHGMAEVKKNIDIFKMLEKLKQDDFDFDYFLDATMLRVWTKDEKAKNILFSKINRIDGLIYITSAMKDKYNINYKHNYFWDECWQVEEGYVIHPNFFGDGGPPLGMHGYIPETQDNKPSYIIYSDKINHNYKGKKINDLDMKKIYSIQRNLLEFDNERIETYFDR